jgi:hypothetical protein
MDVHSLGQPEGVCFRCCVFSLILIHVAQTSASPTTTLRPAASIFLDQGDNQYSFNDSPNALTVVDVFEEAQIQVNEFSGR